MQLNLVIRGELCCDFRRLTTPNESRNVTEKEALIALNMVSGIGAIFVKRLFSRLGAYAAIFEASEAELCEVSQIGMYRASRASCTVPTSTPTRTR